MNFFRMSRQIPEKSDVCRFSINFAKTNQKIAENSEICENYSILFNIIQSCPYLHLVHELFELIHSSRRVRQVCKVRNADSEVALERILRRDVPVAGERDHGKHQVHLGDLYTESGQTLQGSFSADSKPNFASTYSLESSRRDLHNALESNPSLLCTVLESEFEKRSRLIL